MSRIKRFLLPWWAAAAIIALINLLSLIAIATHIEFNNAPELYFPADSPAVNLANSLRKEFPEDETLVAVFGGEDLYSADFVRRQHQVAQAMSRHPLADRVFAVTTMDRITGTDDGFQVEPLIDPASLGEMQPREIRERVLGDRFAPGLLAAKDGSALAVVVRPKHLTESRQRQDLESAIYQAIKDAGLQDRVIAVSGTVALDSAELRSMLVDTTALLPMVMGLGIVLMLWVVGRPAPVIIGTIAMSTVITFTVGMSVLMGKPYTLVSAMVPPLLSAYTTTALIHLYAALARARQAGLKRPLRVLRARDDVHKASLFNVLTTMAGISGLYFTSIPPIQNYAMIGAAGVAVIYLVVFHLVPPLLVQFDAGPWPNRRTVFSYTDKIAFAISKFSMRHAGWVVAGMSLVVALAIPLVLKVEAESDLFKFFPDTHPLTHSTQVTEEKLSGVIGLEVVFDGNKRDAFKDVSQLKALKDFQSWLDKLPGVDRTFSMMDLVEEMNQAFHDNDAEYKRIPDNNKALSQLLLIYDGRDLSELTNRDYQRTRIALSLHVHGAVAIGEVIQKIQAELDRRRLPGVKWDVGGYGRLFADQNELLLDGQISSFLVAFGLIFVLLLIAFRSFVGAGVSLIPNLAPLFFIFAVMGATGMHLDMATVLIAGELLGITVDDTIHLYHGYQKRLEEGASHSFALLRSFEASGRAVLAISVLLTAQFLLLTGSKFQPTVDFGILSATGLLAGQMFELLLLPALLVLLDNRRKQAIKLAWEARQRNRRTGRKP